MAKLTERQERFCKEYIIDLNGTQAAIRAGYSEKTAKEISSENLTKPNIINRIAELTKPKLDELDISAEWILKSLKSVAERCMQAEPVMSKGENGEMIPTGEYKFEHSGANKSLELLGKYQKLFTDKVEHSGSIDLTGKSDAELEAIINGQTNS
jgi:phage terminase small subunit